MTRIYPLQDVAGLGNRRDTGVTIAERRDVATYQLLALPHQAETVAGALGLSMRPGQVTCEPLFTALPTAPGYWMLLTTVAHQFLPELSSKIAGLAYVSDQSHARVVLRLSGASAHAVLRKGCRLDIDPAVFSSGMCAQTVVAEISAYIYRLDDTPSYDLVVPAGYARAFSDWLIASLQEFGGTDS
ncbi:MAG: hypothetical protein HY308_13415 [Gammaproteobacteria bacterium]|nr:hypothetical protein [Gammaproteobacteria bacterium]